MKADDKCATCAHNLERPGFECEFGAACATDSYEDDEGIVRITACDDYQKADDFEYLGKHFRPYGQFGTSETFDSITRKLARDSSLGFWAYPDAKQPYTYEGFYAAAAAAGFGEVDRFECVENGCVYVPCQNELFMLLDRPGGRAVMPNRRKERT